MTGRELAAPLGRLEVEVPHWSASVGIFDKQLRAVAGLGAVRESRQAKGIYKAAAELPPGIYDVEVTLAERSRRQLAAVYPGQTARIAGDTWKLQLSSAAPLAGTSTFQATHARRAETWSRRSTWPQAPGGDSRLFLFVRTLQPERHPNFSGGLYLLDADGTPITDLDEGVRRSAAEGWLAFSAELPAGYYILRRGRRGVRVRYQTVYLCAGWETQVFLAAGARPTMRSMALTMAPLGAGFRADDETAVAAEAIMASLRRTTGEAPITASEKLTRLLRDSRDNPWLSIVAAYSLLRTQERLVRQGRPDKDGELVALEARVREALEPVDEHPDARALRLRADEPSPTPFWYPPLLRPGLVQVQRHAIRHASTIPLDSLTDCVLDNQVTNSPWTAWRQLDRLPRSPRATRTGKAERHLLDHKAPTAQADPSLTAPLVQSTSPKAPVYPLGDDPGTGDVVTATGELAAQAPPASVESLAAPVLQAAQALGETNDSTSLPDKLSLDPTRALGELLDPVEPEAVSAASGLPLARTEEGLEQLRRRGADPAAAPEQPTPALQPAEQAVLAYALKMATQGGPPAALADPVAEAVVQPRPPVTIEDLVTTLRTEADRLLLRHDDEQWRSHGGDPEMARELGTRLRRVADDLLGRADFIAMADAEDRLVYGNGAFLDLVLPPVDEPTARPDPSMQREQRHDNHQAWEAALAGAPLGHGTLPSPVPNRVAEEWELWRSVIEDDTDGHPHAYLNVLRRRGVSSPAEGVLERIKALLPELRQHTSVVAYGSGEDRTESTRRLRALAGELEAAVGDADRPS